MGHNKILNVDVNLNKIIMFLGVCFLLWVVIFACHFYFSVGVHVAVACSRDECRDDVFLLEGEVLGSSASLTRWKIKNIAEKYPNIKTICISSNGGVVADAMNIADEIYARGLNTCLATSYRSRGSSHWPGLCQSSCTWMVLAGKDRILYDDQIELGFHAAKSHWGERADNDLKDLIGKVKMYVGSRPDALAEIEDLSRLSYWAFQQGTKNSTTDCTAHELQSKYPYFTDIRSWGRAPTRSCGLVAPADVKCVLE